MNLRLIIIILFTSFFAFNNIQAQENNTLEQQADKLHKNYKFNEAIEIYNKILTQSTDSLYKISIEKKLILSENGSTLLEVSSSPEVISQHESKSNSFFLNYPNFMDKSWIILDTNFSKTQEAPKSKEFPAVLYFPENSKRIIYSSPDNSGSWNLYSISKINDTLWSAPFMLNEYITSVGNEVLPVLSEDGKTLYFASNGHYGMGGYDLYMSTWDDNLKDWGVPQNMGFPYSSTSNDFLFINTPDNKYSLFSSDRNSDDGEITIYAVKQEDNPLKKSISEEQAKSIARLEIIDNAQTPKNKEQNQETTIYTTAVKEVRKLQNNIRQTQRELDRNRSNYESLENSQEQQELLVKISNQENLLLSMQQDLNVAQSSLQKIEMDFLSKGIIIVDQEEESSEPVTTDKLIEFASNTMGTAPKITIMEPEPEVDLSFKISSEAMIADISEFPKEGLIYQIQLFVISNKASLKALKGLSPVFERKTASGKYLYTVGVFHTYNEALNQLNKVKKQGFPNALIVAYNNGKTLALANARALEKKEKESTLLQVVIEGVSSLPSETVQVIRDETDKDIARVNDDGVTKFAIGPFNSKQEAEKLKIAIENSGVASVVIENIKK